MSARRMGWAAMLAASLAVLVGPVSIGLAYLFEVNARRPVLLMLGSVFVLSAVVVAIRARLRHRLAGAERPPEHRPAIVTLLAATFAWTLLIAGAFVAIRGSGPLDHSVIYATDGVPWARLALLWIVASMGVAMPAARWCARAGALPEGPARF